MSSSIPLVTVLSGDDSLGREKAREFLFESLYQAYGSFEEEYFDSSRESLSEYLVRLATPTIFGDTRLFHLKHVHKLSAPDIKELAETLTLPHTNLHILVEYDAVPKKKTAQSLKLSTLKKRNDVSVQSFSKPKKYLMPKWLGEQVENLFGRRIEPSAAEHLLEYTGYELDRIYPELQKVDIYLPEGAVITQKAIATVTGSGREVTSTDLCTALGTRRWGDVFEITEKFFSEMGSPTMMLTSTMFRHFWLLYKIRLFAERDKATANHYFKAKYKEKNQVAGDIAIAVGFLTEATRNRVYPAIIIPGVIDQATKYSIPELSKVIEIITKYDREIKSGLAESNLDAFRSICYQIIRTGRSAE